MTRTRTAAPPPARVRGTAKESSADQSPDRAIIALTDEVVEGVNVVDHDTVRAVEGRWAVVVRFNVGSDQAHTRSRVYLTATAAQRAVEAARDRGQPAAAVLVELRVVGTLGATS
ncbi:hypothetical protein [Kineococcus aurantiacus]|uniref:Uncharacterized protein n=1 Tax=Kineococcus aurantiacus TaxID=37633 RepID=A0A7Y9ASV7_9ACTN|nr:hypothetical protein [Kineococcus aurantiacus]NYD21378.1 hypothetical protein [Kineococcus aurantiacus]